ASLERYLQEAGRAGRDGYGARCILLFDETDLEIQEHLLALSRLSPALLGRFGRALAAWAGEERDANIEELALSAGVSQRAATSLVTTLVEAGVCERVGEGRIHPTVPLDTLVERVESLRSRFEILRREDARRLRAVRVRFRWCRPASTPTPTPGTRAAGPRWPARRDDAARGRGRARSRGRAGVSAPAARRGGRRPGGGVGRTGPAAAARRRSRVGGRCRTAARRAPPPAAAPARSGPAP